MSDEAVATSGDIGLCGLINLGNTCYLNASIQIMRSIPEWAAACADGVEATVADAASKEAKLLKSYSDLTRGMWGQKKPMVCKPALFLKDLRAAVQGTLYEQFGHPVPNDGQEFIQYMMDQFHEALKTPGPAASETDDVATKAWCEIWRRDYSPLVPILFGLDRVQCICSTCGNISTQYETFNMLKINIGANGETICDMLKKEREPTLIDDYACEKCAPKRGSAQIVRTFVRLPRNLMIVFRRFNENRTKVHLPVIGCAGNSPINFKGLFAEDATDDSANWEYAPIATLDHLGNHMGGHYNAQAYNFVMKKWFMYDDTHAQEIQSPRFGSATYIVLYRAAAAAATPSN
jgi:ubiquitin carboxyl-terminal hydrolase 8